jgi:hypothetical protein
MKRDLVRVGNTGRPALRRPLTPAQFGDLAEIPPELEWLANPKTRRAYKEGCWITTEHYAELGLMFRCYTQHP